MKILISLLLILNITLFINCMKLEDGIKESHRQIQLLAKGLIELKGKQ